MWLSCIRWVQACMCNVATMRQWALAAEEQFWVAYKAHTQKWEHFTLAHAAYCHHAQCTAVIPHHRNLDGILYLLEHSINEDTCMPEFIFNEAPMYQLTGCAHAPYTVENNCCNSTLQY